MSTYRNTLRYLYALQYRGMKFGLRNVRTLLATVGNPERVFPSIHIAGTNGKGSTASFLASVFTEGGYCTGLYTSPHLIRFTERIRIDGREINEGRLVEYVDILRPAIEQTKATFFEATTCVAFLYFADEGVDVAIVEAGLGGRLDATNVLKPLASIVTNVSLDHTEFLGRTVRAIAREKGGIIKHAVPVITGSDDPQVIAVLGRIARVRGTKVHQARNFVRLDARASRGEIALSTRRLRLGAFMPGLEGHYQYANAALALAALDVILRRRGGARRFSRIRASVIRRAFVRVVTNTGLQGRMQRPNTHGRFLLDVAHNPTGMRTLAEEIRRMHTNDLVAVFGVMKDKDYPEMLDALATVARRILAVAPLMDRALPARALAREGRRRGLPVTYAGSVKTGIRRALELAGTGHVLITGSHYVVGEALRALRGENT